MTHVLLPLRKTPGWMILLLSVAACDHSTDLVTSPEADPPAAVSQLIQADAGSVTPAPAGVPFGVSELWRGTTVLEGFGLFSASDNYTDAVTVVRQIEAARARNHKLILNMTGGGHEWYKTGGKFDLAKWKAVMKTYDSPAIKAAVMAGVADGTVIMNSVMDEPNVNDWGGVMTKPLLDEMASYVKQMFPTLPVAVAVRYDWRQHEHYRVVDAILSNYRWIKGDVMAYRDAALAMAKQDGIAIAFSLNMLDGGILDWKTKDCPKTVTAGFGTYSPTCRMTAAQLRDWGQLLGVAGCALVLWRYDQEFLSRPENQQAFRDLGATLAGAPGKSCRRPAGTLPPANSRPTAAFALPVCTAGAGCQFEDGSSDSDGRIVLRNWDFGNGSTSTATNPLITYAAAGTYSVTLSVTDDAGASELVTRSVTINPALNSPPTAAFSVPLCSTGVACNFTDASTSPNGPIKAWSWNFGDGTTSTEVNPSHTFTAAGSYNVTLEVAGAGQTGGVTQSVTVRAAENISPTAAFALPSCTVSVPCQFEDSSRDPDGTITARSWSLGNGETSSATAPSAIYPTPGSYSVTLSVVDNAGDSSAVTQSVTVGPAPNSKPVASFVAPSCVARVPCQFTDRSSDSDGRIDGWEWQLGEGSTSTAANPSVSYAAAGTYSVTLKVTDNGGGVDAITKVLTVKAAPGIQPVAAFSAPKCTAGVVCQFKDASYDPDGTIVSRHWQLGNGSSSKLTDPSTTYAAVRSYSVTLKVTDNTGSTASVTKMIYVPAALAAASPIRLSLSGLAAGDRQYVIASWSGISGTSVDIYRDGALLMTTSNDGRENTIIPLQGPASYSYKVCERGKARCSASVSYKLPSILLSATGWMKEPGLQAMRLTWRGATGAGMDIYRNGGRITTTPNTGSYTNTRRFAGKATYVYRVCVAGTSWCSKTATVTFP